MFGLFKKPIAWDDLEFLFKTSACEIFTNDIDASELDLRRRVDAVLNKGNFKTTPAQKSTLDTAYITVAMSRELRVAFNQAVHPNGQLHAERYAQLQAELNKRLIYFRDTPTLKGLQESLMAGMAQTKPSALPFTTSQAITSVINNQTKSAGTRTPTTSPVISPANQGARLYSSRPLRTDASPNVKSLHSAATQGHAEEQCALGLSYENGDGIEDNCIEAAFWYLLAAKQGDAQAKYRLGLLYKNGLGVNRNWATAAEWINSAAKDGYAPAIQEQVVITTLIDTAYQENAGQRLVTPRESIKTSATPVSDNTTKPTAVTASTTITPQSTEAQFLLGVKYETGNGMSSNYREAARLYKLAAQHGHKKAQFNLSLLYRKGLGVNKDDAEADEWLHRSNSKPN